MVKQELPHMINIGQLIFIHSKNPFENFNKINQIFYVLQGLQTASINQMP